MALRFPKQKELEEYLHLLEEAKKTRPSQTWKGTGTVHFLGAGRNGFYRYGYLKAPSSAKRLEQFMRRAQIRAGYDPVVTSAHREQSVVRYLGPLREIRQGFLPADSYARCQRRIPVETNELSRITARFIDLNPARTRTCPCALAEFGNGLPL